MAYDRDVYEKTEYVREENVKEDVCSVVEQGMWRIRIKQELYVCVCVCVCVYIYIYIYVYIQGVPGGMCQTSGECSLY